MTKWTRAPLAALAVFAVGLQACGSTRTPPLPDTITFDRQHLTKGAAWNRGGISGIVYVPAGENMPSASLQVGVILSSEHQTGAALHGWVRGELAKSNASHFHESDAPEESCRIARTGDRTYLALEVCKSGVGRAACVEADEAADFNTVAACIGSVGSCFEDMCDQRWLARREALDLLVADFLTKR
jgi:hypothetical protein